MRITRPSPSMVVALVALVFAMTGSAAAVVSFARNAGAVDGKSAVSASASNGLAAGKLVAMVGRGPNRGRLPAKFIDTAVPAGSSFGRASDVIDNASEVPFTLVDMGSLGRLEEPPRNLDDERGGEEERDCVDPVRPVGARRRHEDSPGQRPEHRRHRLGRLEKALRARQLLVLDEVRQAGVDRGAEEAGGETCDSRKRDDLTCAPRERERAEDDEAGEIGRDHDPPPRKPVDERADREADRYRR